MHAQKEIFSLRLHREKFLNKIQSLNNVFIAHEQKEVVKQEAVAELMVGILTKHEVLATRTSSASSREADFADLGLVPFFYGNPTGKLPSFRYVFHIFKY